MTDNERALATDTGCLAMTSMFLAKIALTIREHRDWLIRRGRAEIMWQNKRYYDPETGQTFFYHGSDPAPHWQKV